MCRVAYYVATRHPFGKTYDWLSLKGGIKPEKFRRSICESNFYVKIDHDRNSTVLKPFLNSMGLKSGSIDQQWNSTPL